MGYSFGQPPSGISGAGPIEGPQESNRLGFGCWGGLGERAGSGVADARAVADAVPDALAVAEVPGVTDELPEAEPAAPAQLSTVTVYCLSGLPGTISRWYVPGVLLTV
jgi:hypothetical protein